MGMSTNYFDTSMSTSEYEDANRALITKTYRNLIEIENEGLPEADRLEHEKQKQQVKELAVKYGVNLTTRRLIANSPSNRENAQMLTLALEGLEDNLRKLLRNPEEGSDFPFSSLSCS